MALGGSKKFVTYFAVTRVMAVTGMVTDMGLAGEVGGAGARRRVRMLAGGESEVEEGARGVRDEAGCGGGGVAGRWSGAAVGGRRLRGKGGG